MMETIELAIRIPKDVYAEACIEAEREVHPNQDYRWITILRSICNGTPIPKGHGRLIDADKLHHCECKGNFSECDTCLDDDLCNLVNDAPTIIKADDEVEE